jgi:RimJ/RimL family protein N-acetyltransferase
MPELHTERLLLRHWRDADLAPWSAMNADPQVREHFPDLLTAERSAAMMARFEAALAQRGYGWWAVEVRATGAFVGMTGLDPVDEGLPVTGVEIGWRFRPPGPGVTDMPPRPPAPACGSGSTPSGCRRSSR